MAADAVLMTEQDLASNNVLNKKQGHRGWGGREGAGWRDIPVLSLPPGRRVDLGLTTGEDARVTC